jgi:hypothetical protein
MPLQALNRRQHALEEQLRQRLRHHHGTAARGGPSEDDMLEATPAVGGSASRLASTLAQALGSCALVEYVECGGVLYAIVVRGAGRPSLRSLGEAGPMLADLDKLRFAWRRLVTGHGTAASLEAAAELATHAAGLLDDALLAPLAPLLADCPLVVVPPGSLQSLPWPLLPSCADRTVTVAPSAASWLAARSARVPSTPRAPAAPHRVVLIAGPGLPQASAEVKSLAELYPDAEVLTGPDATVAAALHALDGADIAHIAAHGRFRADNPMFSSIVLADGPLTVYDLERLRRAPQAIMLAACDSALSAAHPGDEMTGLASALLAVGARSVVAPLLPLPDEVAIRLACAWHGLLSAGHSPADALAATATAVAQDGLLPKVAASSLVCLGHGG